MPTDINTGTPLSFDQAGLIVIYNTAGTTDYSILRIEPGTCRFKPGLYEHHAVFDKGVPTGDVLLLDQKLSELSFSVRPSEAGISGATDLLTLLVPPAVTAGVRPTFDAEIHIPDTPYSATGQVATLQNCWLQDPWEYQARAGVATDLIAVTLMSTDSAPSFAAF